MKRCREDTVDLNSFTTLEEYKNHISHVCTRAVTYPEDCLEGVLHLFKILQDECKIKDSLRNYIKKITLLSLVSVAVHMLPRISYELSAESDKSSLVNVEIKITGLITELRCQLVRYIRLNLDEEPGLYVPLIAKLAKADNRIYPDLFKLCVEYAKVSQSCYSSLYELFTKGSFQDVSNYISFIFKNNCYNYKVINIINNVNLNKKYHELTLSDELTHTKNADKKKRTDKLDNTVKELITNYLKIIRLRSDMRLMESCIDGISHYVPSMSSSFKLELLNEYKSLISERGSADELLLLINVAKGSVELVRTLDSIDFYWLYDLFKSINDLILPFLYEGALVKSFGSGNYQDEIILSISNKCQSLEFLKCLDSLFTLFSYKSLTTSDIEHIAQLIKRLLSSILLADTNVALTILEYFRQLFDRSSKLSELLDMDGMITSVLSKSVTIYWEMRLLEAHISPDLLKIFKGKYKVPELREFLCNRPCYTSGLDLHTLLYC